MHTLNRPVQQLNASIPLFSARELCYRYSNEIQALSDIHLDIAAGDRIALVGQNGSGKTTLIKLLCGLLQPTVGEMLYKGDRLRGKHLDHARLEIGMLFQDPDDQLFGHTLLEDAAFGPRQQGLSRQQAEYAAREALQRVSLFEMAYKAPHNLSFGQKKRAALAGLLAMKPAVLLLDEPTADLDPCQEQVFLDLLNDFSGTLICISQDLVFLYELCDRAVVLNHGRIRHDGTLRDLVSRRESLRTHGLDFSFRLVSTGANPNPAEKGETNAPRKTPSPSSERSKDEPLVALRNYTYRYPDSTLALSGIDLSIHDGERISIVGENGAGKTTLLSCLIGLRHGHGEFLFAGHPVTRRRRKILWRQVGMVFQDCADQLFCSNVREEIAFGLRQLGYSRAESLKRLEDALLMVRLEGFHERVPLHLSGGERKRLALACVLAMKPRLIVLDEPTAGLDPQGEEVLLEILRVLDATLLLVSHDIFFIKELTDRTLMMHQGRILEDMPTDDFLKDEQLGNLNGLSYSYRQRSSSAIRTLQHEHEHTQLHQHLHAHPHQHTEMKHTHLHEHVHEHPHRFSHKHPGDEKNHDHAAQRHHVHDHEAHDTMNHDHDHSDP